MRDHLLALMLAFGSTATLLSQAPGVEATTGSNRAERMTASATLIDAMKRQVGEARLQETPHGVLLELKLTNVTPGPHALHVHEHGTCDAPGFTSAGGHFAPGDQAHGFLNADGPHAGDLPNIHVPSTLELSLEYLIPDVTLRAGPTSLLDADGSALVIHAGPDDYVTEPAGDAGERLACGAIVHHTL